MRYDLSQPRTGGLMLCECGHTKGFHYARPDYHGGPVTKGNAQCGHCSCAQYAERADQCYRFNQREGE